MTADLPMVTLPGGERVPALGQGTWHMGENRRRIAEEAAAVRLGIELGMTLMDTAEMYGNGGAEEMVAQAAEGLRDELFIVSKVYPHNASRAGVVAACERSLARLRTDRIDLYLLHWRGSIPLAETLAGFEQLRRDSKIRHYGVSNFDRADMAEWVALRQQGMIVIPKAARLEHVRDNRGALDVVLTAEDLSALDRAFPPSKGNSALGML